MYVYVYVCLNIDLCTCSLCSIGDDPVVGSGPRLNSANNASES